MGVFTADSASDIIPAMRVAFVHEWLTKLAGSEKVLAEAMTLYPHAPIHTLVHDLEGTAGSVFAGRTIVPSFISRLPGAKKRYPLYLPLMPLAIEQFDLSPFDLVISSHHAVAKGVLTRADQLHISYVHTPMRYAWDLASHYISDGGVKSWPARWVLHRLRQWDVTTANRVDIFVANSRTVAQRIYKTYRRRAHVINPPVDVHRFPLGREREDFYLTVSRLAPYKKVDVIARAFSQLDRPLIIIGDGPEMKKVAAASGPNVKLMGYQDDAAVAGYMQRCKAFAFMAEEDFGITPIEAMSAGAPMIAYGRGGCAETIEHGKSGLLFAEQSEASLMQAVREFESRANDFNSEQISESVQRYNPQRFREELSRLIDRSWDAFQRRRSSILPSPSGKGIG